MAATRRLASGRSFSMLEVLIAAGVLAVAIFGVLAAIGGSGVLRQTSQESERARLYLQEVLERYRAEPSATAAALVLADHDASYVSGNTLPVPESRGLIDGGLTVQMLAEDEATDLFGPEFAPPHQLDLDQDRVGGEASVDCDRTQYRIIPVRVTVTWRNTQGGTLRSLSLTTVIYPRSQVGG